MKLKLSLTIFGLVAMLGLGVGVGLASRNAPVQEAKADLTYSRIYYVGTENGWAAPNEQDTTYKFHYIGSNNNNHYYQLTVDLVKGSTFKIRDWEEGHESDWMNSFDSSKVYQSLYQDTSNDKNLVCTLTGTYTITYRWTNSNDRCIEGFEVDGNDAYFVVDNNTWGDNLYMHAWKASPKTDYTNWTNACVVRKVSSIKVGTNNYSFFHAKVPTAATNMIFKSNNDSETDYKTADLTNTDGACFSASSVAGVASAGAIIGKIYTNLGSFTNASTQTFADSICAIDATTRGQITTLYNGLDANGLNVFNNSHLNTYNPENLNNKTDVSFENIFEQLGLNTTNGLPRIVTYQSQKETNEVIIIVVASSFALLAIGGYFYLRKRKEDR